MFVGSKRDDARVVAYSSDLFHVAGGTGLDFTLSLSSTLWACLVWMQLKAQAVCRLDAWVCFEPFRERGSIVEMALGTQCQCLESLQRSQALDGVHLG